MTFDTRILWVLYCSFIRNFFTLKNQNPKNPQFISFLEHLKQRGRPFFDFFQTLFKQKKTKNGSIFVSIFVVLCSLLSFTKCVNIEKRKTKKSVFRFILGEFNANWPSAFFLTMGENKNKKAIVRSFRSFSQLQGSGGDNVGRGGKG